jgi:hypothetical protein
MSHFFRNIYLALIALSISYSSCNAMEESDGLLRRNNSSGAALNEKDLKHNAKRELQETDIAPTCCLVYCCLDTAAYYLDVLSNYYFPKDKI